MKANKDKYTLLPTDGTLPPYINSKELQTLLHVGRGAAESFGKQCGAERKVGKRKIYDTKIIIRSIEQD